MDFEILEKRLEKYEKIIEISRKIRIKCSRAIASFHMGKKEELPEKEIKELKKIIEEDPMMWAHASGSINIAFQEYVEAKILFNVDKLPELIELDVPVHTYILGIADAIGEIKRLFLQKIIDKEMETAKKLLDSALFLYDFISTMHYPDSIAPGFRRKKDVARALVNSMLMVYAEKTNP